MDHSDVEELDAQDFADAAEVGSEVAVVDWVDSDAIMSDAWLSKVNMVENGCGGHGGNLLAFRSIIGECSTVSHLIKWT